MVATVGPACDAEATLGAMMEAGINVFRLNFSHGTHESHGAALERIRRLAAKRGTPVAVMADLCGPKIRLGRMAGGPCRLEAGREVVFQRAPIEGTAERLSSTYPALVDDVNIGHRILIDDGNVALRVTARRTDEFTAVCEIGGTVSDHKGINLPDSTVSAPTLTDKDRQDLEWILKHDLDYVALSFVRQPEDLRELREILDRGGSRALIVAKIEKPQAIARLEEVIEETDVVLVARGDLGVEMDIARVPVIQKEIAVLARRAGRPVIIATQMLQSMVESPVPTRAEVSDVANAILDDADAVMLSAETSIGRHPLAAVRLIGRIAAETEAFERRLGINAAANRTGRLEVARAIIHGASLVADELKPKVVVVWTVNGDAARLLSRHRLEPPIVAVTSDQTVCRQMALLYGVLPIHRPEADNPARMMAEMDRILIERKLAACGDQVMVVSDMRPDVAGETDSLFIHVVDPEATA